MLGSTKNQRPLVVSRIRAFLSQIRINAGKRNLIIPVSFALPILILYALDSHSFEIVWKGRTPLLFFLWLLLLELILGWKRLLNGRISWTRFRIVVVIIAIAAPTIYVIATFFLGLNRNIWELGRLLGATLLWHWPISFEYLLFTVFFTASVLLVYGIDGLKRLSISLFFLGATGFFYTIDTFYPSGTIVALQFFAPITASCAIHVLNWMGYSASISRYYEGMPVLRLKGRDIAAIGWPCAGVHSLFIYTFVILLFLKEAKFSLERKVIYVAVGAIGTFMVNVLRIVTICIIGINVGMEAMKLFHSYFGELFFITWIMVYPLTIIYSRIIWAKLSMFVGKLKDGLQDSREK